MNRQVPNYRKVAFRDTVTGKVIVTRSTVETSMSLEHEGEILPLVNLEVSADSHPFYTGVRLPSSSTSRVARFRSRYASTSS